MLPKAKSLEKQTLKTLSILLLVLYVVVCSLSVVAVYQSQNSQHQNFEGLALSDQQLSAYASNNIFTSPHFPRLDLNKISQYRQLSINNSRWYLTFQEPTSLIFTSPLFIVFTLILLVSGFLLCKRLAGEFDVSFKPLQKLEDWAYHAVIEGNANDIALNDSAEGNDIVTLAIHQLQHRIKANIASDIVWDQNIRSSALLDQETRIGNRAFFDNRLQAFVKEEDAQGAVILIHFKELELVQNLYGYQQAMTLLSTLIQVTKQRLHDQTSYFIARQSEYELSVLLPGTFINDVEKLAERLLKNFQTVVLPIGINHEEFVHIGISYFSGEQVPYQIMSEADMALRSAQLQGPSQWFMFKVGELEAVKAKGSLKWRTFLTAAIASNRFVQFYQPVIANDSEKVLHYEVLTKVSDKSGTLIGARVFFPMAKKCGLTVQIDLLILEQVCRILATEEDQQDVYSINISIDSLLSKGFSDKFLEIVQRFSAVKSRIMIEISEYQLVNHLVDLPSVLNAINSAGINVVADKVGQYVVSALYINVYPIYAMKLHRSIVLDIDKKTENQVFVQSLKALAEAKNIPIYALGVENKTEWRTLMQLGVKGGQGHLFTEPLAQVEKATRSA